MAEVNERVAQQYHMMKIQKFFKPVWYYSKAFFRGVANFSGSLTVSGSFGVEEVEVDGSYTITTESKIRCTSDVKVTITLPAVVTENRVIDIMKFGLGDVNIVVSSPVTESIYYSSVESDSLLITTRYDNVTLSSFIDSSSASEKGWVVI